MLVPEVLTKVKYSYWGRTYFIIVSGFVQLNINIHSHKWFSDMHFNYSETHALVSLDYGFNDKWWDTSGICPWKRCLCKFKQWNSLSRNEINVSFLTHNFVSIPYAVVVFFPCETHTFFFLFKESSHGSFTHMHYI